MKGVIRKLILSVNIIAAILLLLSYLSIFIDPQIFWFFAFLGFAFPVFLIINLIFTIFWILFWKRAFLISLAGILLGVIFIVEYVQIPVSKSRRDRTYKLPEKTKNPVKVMSFNVRLFNYYQWDQKPSTEDKIIEFIRKEKPDILCIQEFFSNKDNFDIEKKIKEELQFLQYSHYQFISLKNKKAKFGILTLTRFPIINKGNIQFEETKNLCIFSDIVINNDTIRIYNNHLQSIYLQKKDYEFLANITEEENQIDQFKIISGRVKHAFIKRSKQVRSVSGNIIHSPYPVIVCGDFNDTPVSFTYRKMKGRLTDTFVDSGIGFGNSYGRFLPLFRIDYIFCSNNFTSYHFRVNKTILSDHHPVSCYLIQN